MIACKNFKPDYINKVQEELFAKFDTVNARENKFSLINEVDFKDGLASPFNKSKTRVKDFYSLNGITDKTPPV